MIGGFLGSGFVGIFVFAGILMLVSICMHYSSFFIKFNWVFTLLFLFFCLLLFLVYRFHIFIDLISFPIIILIFLSALFLGVGSIFRIMFSYFDRESK